MLQLGMMPYRVEMMSRTCNSYPRVQKPNEYFTYFYDTNH